MRPSIPLLAAIAMAVCGLDAATASQPGADPSGAQASEADVGVASWTYAWALLAALFGGASGFQGLYDRFDSYAFSLWRTRWGAAYLIIRSIFPAVIFAIAWTNQLLDFHPAWQAILFGGGAEAAIRLKFFVKEGPDGEQLNVGLLDSVKRFERMFLNQVEDVLADWQQELAQRIAPTGIPFPDLLRLVRERVKLAPERRHEPLLEAIASVEALYQEDDEIDESSDDRYASTLAMHLAAKPAFATERELRRLLAKPSE